MNMIYRTLIPQRVICLVYMILLFVTVTVSAQSQDLKTVRIDDRTIQVFPADHRLRLPWGPGNTQTVASSVDNGLENTRKIVNVHGRWVQGDYAAGVCANLNAYGHNDWYLPSRKELQAIYQERGRLSGFSYTSYWSSTDDSQGGEAQAVDFRTGNYQNQPKFQTASVRCVRQSATTGQSGRHAGQNIQKEHVIVASRYAVKSDGSKGLIFGANFLSFFTIATNSIIQEATYSAIAQRIVEETAVEAIKDLGQQAILSLLPGMNASKIRYISYAFPIKEGRQVQVEDVIILLEMEGDNRLVPLNVPVELSYQPGLKNPGAPTVALKHGYDITFDAQAGYQALGLSTLYDRFRTTNLSSANFRFQTFGVVDGYYTTL
jgi:hypothetical protein